MWVTVQKKFRDRHTKEIYLQGKKLNIPKERVEEMNSAGHGQLVKPGKE